MAANLVRLGRLAIRVSGDAPFEGEIVMFACTSATASVRKTLRGTFTVGEGAGILGPAVHWVRAVGGPGSFDAFRIEVGDTFFPCTPPPCEATDFLAARIAGPKSVAPLLSPMLLSIALFPSELEALLVASGLAFLLLGSVDVDLTSDAVELSRVRALTEGMPLRTLLMGRTSLLSCDTEPASFVLAREGEEESFEALCCTRAARNENLGEESKPIPLEPPRCDCVGCGLR